MWNFNFVSKSLYFITCYVAASYEDHLSLSSKKRTKLLLYLPPFLLKPWPRCWSSALVKDAQRYSILFVISGSWDGLIPQVLQFRMYYFLQRLNLFVSVSFDAKLFPQIREMDIWTISRDLLDNKFVKFRHNLAHDYLDTFIQRQSQAATCPY